MPDPDMTPHDETDRRATTTTQAGLAHLTPRELTHELTTTHLLIRILDTL